MKKLCVLPFMHTLIQTDGSIALCCNSENKDTMPNVTDEGIDNILNNPHHIKIRKQMLNGEMPEVCRRCWDNEEMGIKSFRQQQNFTYLKYFPRILSTDSQGVISAGVKYLDVRFNNTCNLKCIMCSSGYSTSWVDDEKKLIPMVESKDLKAELEYRVNTYDKEKYKWAKDEDILTAIIKNAHSLERLHFAGGEPLLSKQHNKLLESLIEMNLSKKLFLSYNSNGEFIDQEVLNLWSQFKRVKIFYSLDHIEDKNEYIRYPNKWSTNVEKFNLIESSSFSNIDWRIATTISVLNVAYIPEMVEWKIQQDFKKIHNNLFDGRLFHGNLLEGPRYLSMTVLPTDIKDQIKFKLQSYKVPKKYKRNYNRIVNDILKYMYSESNTDQLPVLKEYLESTDLIRGTDFKKTFPILKDLF
jgi:MoaA/NifB/PqqE/SkfB family radical SAM enzyme